ncbi:tetratricopeptide repeat protein [Thalassotalea sp. M1531]|uniref:Tetratricopeptide repeat protein n=1 Tax=Thalassotalea algicola TaxID=2716224 RepID=A0A7Y0LEN4_9GAMM|nr:tetratricopeptide repeat protein [Thalassotalea algicola]NMP33056.1 tetratricopeptide repeat protein [Thalassotalea algicola]
MHFAQKSFLIVITFFLACLSKSAIAVDNRTCDLKELDSKKYARAYGPFDYTNSIHYKEKLPIVEVAHFNKNVERLVSGMTGSLAGDIGYTLHAFPNHHKALLAMSKLQKRYSSEHDFTAIYPKRYTATCYFKRAIYFQPRDAVSRMLFAIHLHQSKKLKLAEQQYKGAIKIAPNNPEFHYNIGLLYADLGDLEKAKEHAEIAYSHNYPLPGLANKIKKLEKM